MIDQVLKRFRNAAGVVSQAIGGAVICFLLLSFLGWVVGIVHVKVSQADPAQVDSAQGVDPRAVAEWHAFIAWCDDLLWGKNIETIADPLHAIRYRVGKLLMTDDGLRWHKAHCAKMVQKDWCRRFPESLRCGKDEAPG